ncbi:hypothetical protein CBR_g3682 [Chara braunii]|uniref:Uncharacterized protein n=1 Tax=Chara braunii TaxID=69332 RepID=A0A388KG81_CHABU|nr:hypothetical protein CBR_g3682 [Chara braunii]|eukprot:GBG68983.1 hypothetical protein CBR_g3682 [Chara braunii]
MPKSGRDMQSGGVERMTLRELSRRSWAEDDLPASAAEAKAAGAFRAIQARQSVPVSPRHSGHLAASPSQGSSSSSSSPRHSLGGVATLTPASSPRTGSTTHSPSGMMGGAVASPRYQTSRFFRNSMSGKQTPTSPRGGTAQQMRSVWHGYGLHHQNSRAGVVVRVLWTLSTRRIGVAIAVLFALMSLVMVFNGQESFNLRRSSSGEVDAIQLLREQAGGQGQELPDDVFRNVSAKERKRQTLENYGIRFVKLTKNVAVTGREGGQRGDLAVDDNEIAMPLTYVGGGAKRQPAMNTAQTNRQDSENLHISNNNTVPPIMQLSSVHRKQARARPVLKGGHPCKDFRMQQPQLDKKRTGPRRAHERLQL